MIVRKVIHILNDVNYQNYSDQNVYIKNVRTGLLFTAVNSTIDEQYVETDIVIPEDERINPSDL